MRNRSLERVQEAPEMDGVADSVEIAVDSKEVVARDSFDEETLEISLRVWEADVR